MSLCVQNPGMLATIQDLGRDGHGAIGVSRSGAADELSLRVGNRMLGTPDHAAAIECTLVGGVFTFRRATRFVLTGAGVNASLRSRVGRSTVVRDWQPTRADAGDVLDIGPMRGGSRTYLCVRGGFESPSALGSRSTQVSHTGGGVGGPRDAGALGGTGRPLRAGDVVEVHAGPLEGADPGPAEPVRSLCREMVGRRTLRVVLGPHAGTLAAEASNRLHSGVFRVSDQFDRRGFRLTPALSPAPGDGGMLTQPMDYGFIQATPGGDLIILGPDAPPTGGYPVVACVASVDLPAVGQVRPRDEVRFEFVDIASARALHADLWRTIDRGLPPA